MSTAAPPMPPDLAEIPPCPVHRLSVGEFLRMIELGVLDDPERLELLEGWLTTKPMRDPPHDAAIELGFEALRLVLPVGWRVRAQSGSVTADSVPEPDLAVVRGNPRDYLDRHPGPEDIALVVEVADSSLAKDRTLKARLYARAGIPAYWIVNLVEGLIEVHTEPTGPAESPMYRQRAEVRPGEAIALVVDGREVAAADLLP